MGLSEVAHSLIELAQLAVYLGSPRVCLQIVLIKIDGARAISLRIFPLAKLQYKRVRGRVRAWIALYGTFIAEAARLQ